MQTLKTIQQYSGKRQQGMSVIGLLIVLSLAGFLAITAMKIVPMYLQFYSVKSAIESLRNENVSSMSAEEIQKSLQKRFDTGYVENVMAKDMKVRNERKGKVLDFNYRDERELFYMLHIMLKHNEVVPLYK